jgi:hypothetical protein
MGEPPRSAALAARSYLPLAITLLVAAGFLTVVRAHPPATATPSAVATCDPAAVMNHRLDELGRDGYTWTIKPSPLDDEYHLGLTGFDEPIVIISDKVTCDLMTTVVNHEWLHVQQAHTYPGHVDEAYGGRAEVELIADCGSMLLGSRYTPYITRHRQNTGDRGCTDYELASAQSLIGKAHPPG